MHSSTATIISVENGVANVSVDRGIICSRCAAGKGCGAGLIGTSSKTITLSIPLAGNTDLREGDEVRLTMEPIHLMRASLMVYGLPLVGAVAALSAAWLISGPMSDGESILVAAAGLLIGLGIGRYQLNRDECLAQFVPRIAAHSPASDIEPVSRAGDGR